MKKTLDCTSARALFSEHQDRRLRGDSRRELVQHLDHCEACRTRWSFYAGVFEIVSDARELPAARKFVLPREAPGGLERPALRAVAASRWRMAAAAAILLAVTHVAVFEWARGGGGEEILRPHDPAVAPVSHRPIEAGFFPQRLRDHVDAAEVLSRQIAHMPADAGDEARQLVAAQLEVLRPDALIEESERASVAGTNLRFASQNYLHTWNGFSRAALEGMSRREDAALVGWLQDILNASPVSDALAIARNQVAGEAAAGSFRNVDFGVTLNRGRPATSPASETVRRFLGAHGDVLRANYPVAGAAFQNFRRFEAQSRLRPLAAYMEADCLRRVGQCEQAAIIVLQNNAIQFRCVRVVGQDPLVGATVFMSRSLPPSALQFMSVPGAGFAPSPPGFDESVVEDILKEWRCPTNGPMAAWIKTGNPPPQVTEPLKSVSQGKPRIPR